jgi:hypothetical protein
VLLISNHNNHNNRVIRDSRLDSVKARMMSISYSRVFTRMIVSMINGIRVVSIMIISRIIRANVLSKSME